MVMPELGADDVPPLEAGDPAQDQRAFRRCLGQFGTGVTVVTTRRDGLAIGMTANSFSSLSLDPPLILWSVAKSSSRAVAFRSSTHFAVNVLRRNQVDLAQHFAKNKSVDGCASSKGLMGVPVLDGVVASLECELVSETDAGDHVILVGRVHRYATYPGEPLLFVQGRFMESAEYPRPAITLGMNGPSSSDGESLLGLLFRAQRTLSHRLEELRQAEGFNVMEGAMLAGIVAYPGDDLEVVASRIHLDPRAARETASALAARGLVEQAVDQRCRLTPHGRERWSAIQGRLREFERHEFGRVAGSDMHAFTDVLRAVVHDMARRGPDDREAGRGHVESGRRASSGRSPPT